MITIAVDGPSGAGKSTVTDLVANKLGILHFNAGAIYRAIGVYCIENNLNVKDEDLINSKLSDIEIRVEFKNNEQRTILNGEDITSKLYTMQVSDVSSITSAYKNVRAKILNIQRNVAKQTSVIMEGRDITSHVLPDAKYKFYIDASPEVRAQRRIDDKKSDGGLLSYEEVLKEIIERDRRDKTRALCPLVLVDDAIYINTDDLTAEKTAEKIISYIK